MSDMAIRAVIVGIVAWGVLVYIVADLHMMVRAMRDEQRSQSTTIIRNDNYVPGEDPYYTKLRTDLLQTTYAKRQAEPIFEDEEEE